MRILSLLMILMMAMACHPPQPAIQISRFAPFTNFSADTAGDLNLTADLAHAITEGIKYPTVRQIPSGKFVMEFEVENLTDSSQTLYYKIFYQNESYKFQEDNPRSRDNFYGSWNDTTLGFKPLPRLGPGKKTQKSDSLQIVGNPRNELRYYGMQLIPQARLEQKMNEIRSNKKWLASTAKQAKNRGISLEDMIYANARYVLEREKTQNLRWRRNPRPGRYSFLLVVVTESYLKQIPAWVRHIHKTNPMGEFVNPYSYFLQQETPQLIAQKAPGGLVTSVEMSPENGLYVHRNYQRDTAHYCNTCAHNDTLFHTAHYEQFFNTIIYNKPFRNIPLLHNVVKDGYTRETFRRNAKKYPLDSLRKSWQPGQAYRVRDYAYIPDYACETVKYDSAAKAFRIINTGNAGKAHPRKQNTGVKTRIGMTYGTFTGKIKFPELLNKDNVWNGLTNAYWLFRQSGQAWNKRGVCHGKGYVKKSGSDKDPEYVPRSSYSEIDIEIVKASKYIKPKETKADKDYDPALSENIIVACTNHDLACQEPEDFGSRETAYQGQEFRTHRWYPTYRAKFLKTPVNENEMFQRDFYYFQIEWHPSQIIWRVGPSRDNMRVVGYMDEKTTKIPDNQMIVIVSQEFHHGDWWPTTPFHQDNIPYPKDDIVGIVYDIRAE